MMQEQEEPPKPFAFPYKLHDILEDAETVGFENIISWLPNGRGFKIHSKKRFEAQILPCYYKTSTAPKYRSFSRQLAIYGFKLNKDTASLECGVCNHPLFVRGQPELCSGMVRRRIKGNTTKMKMPRNTAAEQEFQSPEPFVPVSQKGPASAHSVTSDVSSVSNGDVPATAGRASTKRLGGDSSRQNDDLLNFAIFANKYIDEQSKKKGTCIHLDDATMQECQTQYEDECAGSSSKAASFLKRGRITNKSGQDQRLCVVPQAAFCLENHDSASSSKGMLMVCNPSDASGALTYCGMPESMVLALVENILTADSRNPTSQPSSSWWS